MTGSRSEVKLPMSWFASSAQAGESAHEVKRMGNIVVFKHAPAPGDGQLADLQINDPEFKSRRLVSTRELSAIWGVPESTLRYWRCAEVGPPYVKLGGRIKYDLVDVELYVRANKRNPSVRAHGG